MKYDLIIIGGGSGGFASAIQANELGLKTLMINSRLPIGRTCVNVGCVPSKALIHFAKIKNFDFATAIENELNLVNVPPIEGIKEVGYLTHISALENKNLPQSLAIIGASPMGLEFSQIYSRFGSKVIILQKGNSIFPPGEKELTQRLKEVLQKEGIEIRLNVDVKSVRKEGDKKIVKFLVEGREEEISVDEILLAAGKTPNTDDLSEIISQAIWLIKNKNTIDDLINSTPVFPTLSEALKICVLSFYKDISKISCCI